MEELKQTIESVIKEELIRANEANENKFNSAHEGYAVILEEVQEANEELNNLIAKLGSAWNSIRKDNRDGCIDRMHLVRKRALLLACEAVQVAAMSQKLIDSI